MLTLVVAHPDDEIIFGGELLFYDRDVEVICVTCGGNSVRREEFVRVMGLIGVRSQILDFDDSFGGFGGADLGCVRSLAGGEVISHNADGEYGHRQHVELNRCLGPSRSFFLGGRLPVEVIEWKLELLKLYKSQSRVIGKAEIMEWVCCGRVG